MAPPRTGSVEPGRRADGSIYFRARIRLADDSRQRVDVPEAYAKPAGGMTARERAELYARALQEREDDGGEEGPLLVAKRAREGEEAKKHDTVRGETCEKYFARLSAAREAEGVRDVRNERRMWARWVSPRIGGRPVAAVTRDEIEAIRDVLDEKVRERIKGGLEAGISGDTAQNVWTVLRTTFKEALASRDRTLRVRPDDPTLGHKPPLKTPPRQKTFLYPVEVANLLACKDVPREWREVYAVASYSYVRPEELQAFTWRDVDLDAGTLSVSKAIGGRSGKPKPLPKTQSAVRDVPIDPSLAPLLKRMRDETHDDDAPILPLLREVNDKFRAKLLREHLRRAGITRPRVFAETVTLRQVDFRSLRDTGITWLALAGLGVDKMKRRAGHEELETTLGYVKMAEDLTGKVGVPFAPLPAELLQPRIGPSDRRTLKSIGKLERDTGLEPATFGLGRRSVSELFPALATGVGQTRVTGLWVSRAACLSAVSARCA
jgi:integrase